MASKKTKSRIEQIRKAQGRRDSLVPPSPTSIKGVTAPTDVFLPPGQSIKGVTAPPPGQAPAAPAGVAAQPFDPELEAAKLSAGFNIGLSDAESAYQRGQTAYNTGYDASGARNFANPYSQAQLLEDQWRRSLLGTRNSYASMGQYNSGAYGRAKAREDRLYAVDSDSLQRQALDAYHGIGSGQLQTYAGNTLGVNTDAYNALKRAIYGS